MIGKIILIWLAVSSCFLCYIVDSFKDFLKAKEVSSDFKAKSSFSPLSAQTDHFPTKTGNKFLNGLETDK